MRTFYKQILDRTYEIFGARQTDNMEPDQITFLLNALENVSSMYSYIAKEDQQKIINKRMITDKEYKNINARLIAGWFEQDGKIFFIQACHKDAQQPEDYKPLEGDDRDKAIQNFLDAVANATTTLTDATTERKGSGSRLKENLNSHNIVRPQYEAVREEVKPEFLCVMNGTCKTQCERCSEEQKIMSLTETKQ